jgi:metallo-beta-lactamase family protein
MNPDSLCFTGAAGTVTGSRHLLRAAGDAVLLDCGLFQGPRALRDRNWNHPPFEAASVDAVVLSHAHLDHTGYLPVLVKRGFSGPIYCSDGTAELLGLVLLDAARLQEEEARRAAERDVDAPPLFTITDVEDALALVRRSPYDQPFAVSRRLHAVLRRAGHILGSATVEIQTPSCRVVYSGDLGRRHHPILRPPAPVQHADILLVEATYGDRVHSTDSLAVLEQVIHQAVAARGVVVVPSFAIGRAQDLIWHLRRLEDEQRIPEVPVYLDSPMAIDATEMFCRHPEDHNLAMKDLMDARRCPLCCHRFTVVRDAKASRALVERDGPMVVIAGSGMVTGGRVLHHLERRLGDPRNTVLLAGYQGAGTRGRRLQDGSETVRIYGRDLPVRARVVTVDGLSAHADRDDLLAWLSGFSPPPAHTYVVHAEAAGANALVAALEGRGWSASVAVDGATVPLSV